MAKFVEKVLESVGVDKALHFLVGALLTALVFPLGHWWIEGMILFVFVISIVKEAFMDEMFDWWDIVAAMIGSLSSYIIMALLALI